MEVRFAMLADSANVTREGKLNITGIFNQIYAKVFPAGHMAAHLVTQIEAHAGEVGTHELRILFVDDDGKLIMETKMEMIVEEPSDPSKPIRANNILPLQVIPLPAPGDYSFDLFIDGRYEMSVPLSAHVVES